MITCEVCVENVSSALEVERLGIDRIELCADLVIGGTTPSAGLLESIVSEANIPVMAMIRPRPGNFIFDRHDVHVMLRDIEIAKKAEAAGVVIGALTAERTIDLDLCRTLIEAARPMEVTFHRAFDLVEQPLQALDQLVELGVNRILTSGQEQSVADGIALIKELIDRAGDAVSIMPGAGVKANNVESILQQSGAREIHFSGGNSAADTAAGQLERAFGSRLKNDANSIRELLTRIRNLDR